MNSNKVYISGVGVICPLGNNPTELEQAVRQNRTAIRPLELFDLLKGEMLPVGQIDFEGDHELPRTHQLAHVAASQAMANQKNPPGAMVIGTTTGGILTTETLLREGVEEKAQYRYHGLQSVTDSLAEALHCSGPALSVSTACSSGVVALFLGLRLLRSGMTESVLVGGVDSLSRLTYFGFHSLQLVDRKGCRPLDEQRQGMAVAEGAGMLLLTTKKDESCIAELLGAGLSCDAHHATAPHPEGEGALAAMQSALVDSGVRPEDIDYISLHGTGTPDNDLAESRGVRKLFQNQPPLSSIKGATGHTLAAAGAIEAVLSVIALSKDLLPANTGLQNLDPALGISPLMEPEEKKIAGVLSNSFGFGGNNGSLVFSALDSFSAERKSRVMSSEKLIVQGFSCVSGAGLTTATLEKIKEGESVAGMADATIISKELPPRLIRRLKRLPRLTLALAQSAYVDSGGDLKCCDSVFMGTAWGAMSETHDFLKRLNDTEEQFPSPTDFIGSVHNAPAGQVAILGGATGPNITCSGGDYSFEQALMAAELTSSDQQRSGDALLLGADEGHEVFSPLFDGSIEKGSNLCDGGGALWVKRGGVGKASISLSFFARSSSEDVITSLSRSLKCFQGEGGGSGTGGCVTGGGVAVLAGIPASMRTSAEAQLKEFQTITQLSVPVIDYRKLVGEFSSASAVAAALAAALIDDGCIPAGLTGDGDRLISKVGETVLVLGLGDYVTAMEITRI